MDDLEFKITNIIQESIECKLQIVKDANLIDKLIKVAEEITVSLQNNRKVLFCGNGGSAADAQHLAAELSGRFYQDRPSLNSEALHVNTSYLTAVANDYSFDEVYSRLISGRGNKGDVLVSLSTSGNSVNVVKAIKEANGLGMITVGLTGKSGGKVIEHCKYSIQVPSDDTPRIQESHIMLGHIICEMVENKLFD